MTKLFDSLNSHPLFICCRPYNLLWFGGVFTIRFVGSLPFLLVLSGQAKYFFIPFTAGTSKPNQTKQQQNKNILNKIK